jgi:hypothetical protein
MFSMGVLAAEVPQVVREFQRSDGVTVSAVEEEIDGVVAFVGYSCWFEREMTRKMESASIEATFSYIWREIKMGRDNDEVWNCQAPLSVECPLQWENLEPTNASDIRFCDVCQRNVFYCETPDRFLEAARQGRCVAIPAKFDHQHPSNLNSRMGLPSIEGFAEMDESKRWWDYVNENDPERVTNGFDDRRADAAWRDQTRQNLSQNPIVESDADHT